jgi:hypothetical protein
MPKPKPHPILKVAALMMKRDAIEARLIPIRKALWKLGNCCWSSNRGASPDRAQLLPPLQNGAHAPQQRDLRRLRRPRAGREARLMSARKLHLVAAALPVLAAPACLFYRRGNGTNDQADSGGSVGIRTKH